jgi:hypothetical protein
VKVIRRLGVVTVLGITAVGAAWAYTYQVPVVYTFVDRYGTYHPPDRSTEQAWWAAPVTLLIILAGAAAVMWLMPERRRIFRSFGRQFGMSAPRRGQNVSRAVGFREHTH